MHWKLRKDGMIALSSLAGWETATPGGVACAVRLTLYPSEESLATGQAHYEQVVMTASQAAELGQALQRISARLLQPPAPERTRN